VQARTTPCRCAIAAINSAIQLEVEESLRGRIMSMFMLAWVPFPIGSLVAGAVAAGLGVQATTLAGAICCAAWGVGLAWWLRGPSRQPVLDTP
jgi:small-conductance mechanosensitive channel